MPLKKMPDLYAYPLTTEDLKGGGLEVESIDVTGPILVHIQGQKYPYKGIATEQAVQAINITKVLLRSFLSPTLHPRRHLQRFTEESWKILSPFILKEEHQMTFTKEMKRFVEHLYLLPEKSWNERLAQIIAHLFEYDSAYRARIQDLLTESSKGELIRWPIGELWRLVKINKQRDYLGVHKKMEKMAMIATVLLLIPPLRKRFKRALLQAHYENFCLDDIDSYWLSQRRDYGVNNTNPIT